MISLAVTAKLIRSLAVTAKLIRDFVFAYADCWFSHAAAQMCDVCQTASAFKILISDIDVITYYSRIKV